MKVNDNKGLIFVILTIFIIQIVICAVSAEETSLAQIFPKSVNGENGMYLQYRTGGTYVTMPYNDPYRFVRMAQPFKVPGISRYSYPNPTELLDDYIAAHPSAIVQCNLDADAIIRVTIPYDGTIYVSGLAGKDSGSVTHYIYLGASGYSQPLWSSASGGNFNLTLNNVKGQELFFGTSAGSDDVNDWAWWRYLKITSTEFSCGESTSFSYSPDKIRPKDVVTFTPTPQSSSYRYTWDFGDKTPSLTNNGDPIDHSFNDPGDYTVNLVIHGEDGCISTYSQKVSVKIPVVLVHGWTGSSTDLEPLANQLRNDGHQVKNFNYGSISSFTDPRIPAKGLKTIIDSDRKSKSYNGQEYTGKYDIVCHSMGAQVTRWYMEKLGQGENVRQWIGVAPVNHGAALADFDTLSPGVLQNIVAMGNIDSIYSLKTTSDVSTGLDEYIEKNREGYPGVKYRVIMAYNGNYDRKYGLKGIFSGRTWAKKDNRYYLTWFGDGIVANQQSDLDFAEKDYLSGYEHGPMIKQVSIINRVSEYIENIDTHSQNNPPHGGDMDNSGMYFGKADKGTLGPGIINIFKFAVRDTADDRIKLGFIIIWPGSDVNATLISPSGVRIHPDSVNDTEYGKSNNMIYYSLDNPEPGEWTAEIDPVDIPETGEPFTFSSFFESDSPITLNGTYDQKPGYYKGDTLGIYGSLFNGSIPVSGANLFLKVTYSDNSTQNFLLYDDATHGDTKKDDGIYTSTVSLSESGATDFIISTNGTKTNSFELSNFFSLYIEPLRIQNATLFETNPLPRSMLVGTPQMINITLLNSGTTTWEPSVNGHEIALYEYQHENGPATFGTYRVSIPSGTTVVPGAAYTFPVLLTPPSQPGTYSVSFRMGWKDMQWFGDTITQSIKVTVPTPDAAVVSDTIPTTMQAGQSYPVSVTLKNTGSITWQNTVNGHQMMLFDYPRDSGAGVFTANLIQFPQDVTVAPNDTYTFNFTMTAPTAAGVYNANYRMGWKDVMWFGQTDTKSVTVTVPTPNAAVVSDTIPTAMQAGQSYPVSVTLKNTGSITWQNTVNGHQMMLFDYPRDSGAGVFTANLIQFPQEVTVAPNNTYTFNFTMTAPTAAGVYNANYRMGWKDVMWFGQTDTKSVTVTVPTPNAAVVSDTIPTTMQAGQSYPVSVTLKNTGSIAWQNVVNGHQMMLFEYPRDSGPGVFTANLIQIPQDVTVALNDTYTFNFIMIAPTAAGVYNANYRMGWKDIMWFGMQDSHTITVNPAPSPMNADLSGTNPLSTSMVAGTSQSVTITMQNTGTTAWQSSLNGHEIALYEYLHENGPGTFGTYRVPIPAGTIVAPGETYSFTVPLTAPTQPGTYSISYRMGWKDVQWFGTQVTQSIVVIPIAKPVLKAELIGTNPLPSSLGAGDSQSVTITMQNTGTTAWQSPLNDHEIALYEYLHENGPGSFGTYRVPIPAGTTVAPGETYSFTVPLTAPTQPGTYSLSFKMGWKDMQWFGDPITQSIKVTVPTPNAVVISDTIPSTMQAGQPYPVAVTLKNTGSITWQNTVNGHAMMLFDYPRDSGAGVFTANLMQIPQGVTVAPNDTYTFNFTMTAPITAGVYSANYRMGWKDVMWFGQTDTKSITVTVPTPNAQLSGDNPLPTTMVAGSSQSVIISLENIGTIPWQSSVNGHEIALYEYQHETGPGTFGTYRVPIPAGTTVAPGETYSFTVPLTTPSTPGTYMLSFRMGWKDQQWFGTPVTQTITVTPLILNAQPTGLNPLPTSMNRGSTQAVTINMNNTGNIAWQPSLNGHEIALYENVNGGIPSSGTFGVNKIPLSVSSVPVGVIQPFNCTLTAPAQPGTYSLTYRMGWKDQQWFGTPVSQSVIVK